MSTDELGRGRPAHVEQCPHCPSRGVTTGHVDECALIAEARVWVTECAALSDVPDVTAGDLWSHLLSLPGLSAANAAAAVCVVTGLGWRPVVGQDPARLWQRPDGAS